MGKSRNTDKHGKYVDYRRKNNKKKKNKKFDSGEFSRPDEYYEPINPQ